MPKLKTKIVKKTHKVKLWQNLNCDKTQQLKMGTNSNFDQTQMATKLKLWRRKKLKTQYVMTKIVTILKNSKKKIKNANCDKTKKKLWWLQNSEGRLKKPIESVMMIIAGPRLVITLS